MFDLKTNVFNIIWEFTLKSKSFTAYDITKKLRNEFLDEFIKHDIVRNEVHNYMRNEVEDYAVTNVNIGIHNPILYYDVSILTEDEAIDNYIMESISQINKHVVGVNKTIIVKICSCCKETKFLSEFPKDRTRKDGYAYICKECKNAYRKENIVELTS